MKHKIIFALFVCLLFSVRFADAREKGTVRVDQLVSPALAGNPAGESAGREVAIYLPPGYDRSEKRYPTLYLLHGMGDDHLNFVDDETEFQNIQSLLDEGIARRRLAEMIVVTPNESTRWGGSFYVNSAATGNWEDFTARELVAYVDANYRTVARPAARAVAGHSMGGFGAVVLAMKHPDVFGIAYSMNGGFIAFDGELGPRNPEIRKFVAARTTAALLATKSREAIGMLAVAQAFSPNPDAAPFYADKPYKLRGGRLVPEPAAYNRWLDYDVVRMADRYRENLLKLRALKFDAGFDEEFRFININNRRFSEKLTALGIPHVFEEYNGNHRNRLWGINGRISTELLPFVTANFEKFCQSCRL
ncbi:MAG: alpha/beta fold hydrolase [Acidobacteria bacterium]|nr:alpha/beta fold hydrolase [Acidobacteriota bacterium]